MAWMQEIDRCSQSHQFFGKPCSLYQSLAVSLISEKEVDLRSALSVEMAILDTRPSQWFSSDFNTTKISGTDMLSCDSGCVADLTSFRSRFGLGFQAAFLLNLF